VYFRLVAFGFPPVFRPVFSLLYEHLTTNQ
jgi:hypothetical protein